MNSSPDPLLVAAISLFIVGAIGYAFGKGNGYEEGKKQADENLEYSYSRLIEDLEDSKATIEGHKKTIREQRAYISQLEAYIDQSK